MNLTGFIIVARSGPERRSHLELRVVLAMICLGMLLQAFISMVASRQELTLSAFFAPEDGLRIRLLRLAGVSAVALPVLWLLHQGLVVRAGSRCWAARWGRIGMLCGTIGMPMILTAASLTRVEWKLLLAIPAAALFTGTLCGVWLARRYALRLELSGWILIALSMAGGLFMGLYAFDGPFKAPGLLGAYSDVGRRLTRVIHTYSIVFGMVGIFLSRELEGLDHPRSLRRIGLPLLAAGGATTLLVVVLFARIALPTATLALGPALVAIAMLLCIGRIAHGARPVRQDLGQSPRGGQS